MKKLIFLTLLLFTSLISQAQLTLTRGEVYNYEIGDEFLTRLTYFSFFNHDYPPDNHFERTTILNKTFSADMDTVFYYCLLETQHIYYHPPFMPPNDEDTTYAEENISLFYTDLDSLIQDFGGYDPCYADSIDTVYISTTQYCSRKVYTKNYVWGQDCFEPSGYVPEYVEGCGGPYWESSSSSNGATTYFDLIYYKKGNDSCGTDISISVGLQEQNNNRYDITLYPNPATNTLTINTDPIAIGLNLKNAQLQIHNAQGQLVTHPLSRGECASLSAGKGCVIDVSQLNSGIYFLSLTNGTEVMSKKFVKQ